MSQIRSSRSVRRPIWTPPRLQLEYLEDRITPSVTVNTILDLAPPITGQVSLREAINMVNAGQVADNTIILPSGSYQNALGAFDITHSLILQGGGAASTTINGTHNPNTDHIFVIEPSTSINVQVSGVTLTGGDTGENGGAIDLLDAPALASTLTLSNCVVTGNQAVGAGGGIAINRGSLNLIDTQVTNNSAGGSGGGIAVLGGNGSVTISGSTISGNSLTSNTTGGGGLCLDTTGTVAITDSTISNNVSLQDGGGIDNINDAPSGFTLTGDTLDGNQAKGGNGGAIAVTTAVNLTVQNSTLDNNTASVSGGGINDSGNGNLAITDCTIGNNQAKRDVGGGIDYTGGGTIAIANSVLSDNVARINFNTSFAGGGGLEVNNAAALTTIVDSLFTGNIAQGSGGGIDIQASLALTATGSTISGNQTQGNSDGGGLAISTSGTAAAGTASSLIDDTITGNKAGGNGGGVELFFNSQVNFASDTINGNASQVEGGGVRVGGTNATANFLDTIVAGNSVPNAANGADISNIGTVLSKGGNVIGDNTQVATVFPAGGPNANGDFAGTNANPLNPLLGPLQDNGGILAGAPGSQQIVPTEALLAGSPALGNGIVSGAPTTDERGFNRVVNGPIDIGALQTQNALLTIAIAPTTSTATLNGTETFTITVTNSSDNALSAGNSTLTVTLSGGLTTTGPLTFSLAALPAGQSQTFALTTTTTTLGTQTLTAVVSNSDSTPTAATINVVTNTPPISPPATPLGGLTLFGFGFGPTGLDVFEIDGKGDVFAQGFGFGGISGSPQFIAADAVFRNLALMKGAIVADLVGGNGQSFLMEVLNFSDSFVFQGLLNALFAGK